MKTRYFLGIYYGDLSTRAYHVSKTISKYYSNSYKYGISRIKRENHFGFRKYEPCLMLMMLEELYE